MNEPVPVSWRRTELAGFAPVKWLRTGARSLESGNENGDNVEDGESELVGPPVN